VTVLLGIDIGTTNWKVSAFGEDARLISLKKTSTKTYYDENGWGYYNPEEIWDEIAQLIKQITTELNGTPIDAVSVTSMGETIVPIDEKGNVCFNAIAWFDTRARTQAESVRKELGLKKIFNITGLEPNPIFPLFKLLWIKDTYPEIYKKAQKWLQMADFIYWRLCGEFVTDYTLASRTLAMDIHTCQWSHELINCFNLKTDLFPPIIKSGTVIGKVSRDVYKKTGLLEGTAVVVGGHDHPCATLAAGVKPGENVLDSSGTAESFLFVSDADAAVPLRFDGLRICRFLDPLNYVSWGGIISSGAAIDWSLKLLLSDIPDQNSRYDFFKEVTNIRTKTGSLLFLPHLRGSGAPFWKAEDKGAFLGLQSRHSRYDLIWAVLTGLCFQARLITELQQKISKASIKSICTVGGGSRIKIWQQIKADVTGKIVKIPEVIEASLLGAAILAGVGIGVYEDIYHGSEKVNKIKEKYYPDGTNKGFYEGLFSIYKEACGCLSDINKKLDNMV
jgi:xylulokinase